VLLLFLLVLVVLSAGQLLRRLNEEATTAYAADRLARSGAALAEAKRALLGAAVAFESWQPATTARGPGRFTCAALATDLVAQGEPDCASGTLSGGLFPRTLSDTTRPAMPPIFDASDTPLVLVMDSRFRKVPAATVASFPIHRGYTPALRLGGSPVVALLFGPGPVQPGESRPTGAVALEQYLEDLENTDGDADFVSPDPLISNDVVLAVTHTDLLCAIRPRVRAARLTQEAFDADPVANPPPPAWYANEGWHSDNGSGVTRGAELETLTCVSSAL
jgi:hypothetical protein